MELQVDDILIYYNVGVIRVNPPDGCSLHLGRQQDGSYKILSIIRDSCMTGVTNKLACIVYRITNLHTHLDEQRNKTFQRFTCGPYQLVTGNHYVEDQLGVVIPAGAIVPDNISKEMWVYNRLGGKKKNRVMQKTMYNYQTDGLFYGRTWMDLDSTVKRGLLWNDAWKEGDDVTQELGVTFNG
jgi:hypothetical protein